SRFTGGDGHAGTPCRRRFRRLQRCQTAEEPPEYRAPTHRHRLPAAVSITARPHSGDRLDPPPGFRTKDQNLVSTSKDRLAPTRILGIDDNHAPARDEYSCVVGTKPAVFGHFRTAQMLKWRPRTPGE